MVVRDDGGGEGGDESVDVAGEVLASDVATRGEDGVEVSEEESLCGDGVSDGDTGDESAALGVGGEAVEEGVGSTDFEGSAFEGQAAELAFEEEVDVLAGEEGGHGGVLCSGERSARVP